MRIWRARWCAGPSATSSRWRSEQAVNPAVIRFLNRLSDHLFVLGRVLNAGSDVTWVPGANR